MMIFSRLPIAQFQQLQPISEYYPYLAATLQLPSGPVALLSIHPPRPLRHRNALRSGGETAGRNVRFVLRCGQPGF